MSNKSPYNQPSSPAPVLRAVEGLSLRMQALQTEIQVSKAKLDTLRQHHQQLKQQQTDLDKLATRTVR